MSRTLCPVAPDSVYVWRGFRSSTVTPDQFVQFLGTVFVPACALLQPPVGLRAYVTTIVPAMNKPSGVPDQTALMFWATPQAHNLATKAVAERIYLNLHGDAYDMARSHTTEVPLSLAAATGTLAADQPYYLLDQQADWMQGSVDHFIGVRRTETTPADFLAAAYAWSSAFRASPPRGVDAALVSCSNDCLVAWAHSADADPSLGDALDGLAALTTPVLHVAPTPLKLQAGLWNDWPGIDLVKDSSINVQFERAEVVGPTVGHSVHP
jgi:hypothetical protein